MTQLSSFNKSSGKNFFGVMLVVALALHAAVLGIPTGANSKGSDHSKPDEKKSQVEPSPSASPKVTPKESDADSDKTASKPILKKSIPATTRKSLPQLARKTTPSSTPRKTAPKTSQKTSSQASTSPKKSSTTSTSRASTSRASTSTTSTSRASTSTTSTSRASTSTTSTSRASASTSKSRASTQSSSTSTQTQNISTNSTNSNSSTQKKPNPSTPTKPLLPPQQNVAVTFDNFSKGLPFYFGSLLTSSGIIKSEFDNRHKPAYIYHTTDELDKVTTEFKKELEAKGFTIKEETKESNFQVYRVTKDGKDQFIHFVNKDKKTAIFMDEKLYKLEEIENKSPENKPSIVVNFYDAFKQHIRDKSDLQLEKIKASDIELLRKNEALKNLSKTTEDADIEQLLLDRLQVTTSPTKPLDIKQTAEAITTELTKGDNPFTFTKVDGYGGDNLALYEVKQGELKMYMILTSTPETEKVLSQTDKVESQPDKLPKTAILFAKKDPRE